MSVPPRPRAPRPERGGKAVPLPAGQSAARLELYSPSALVSRSLTLYVTLVNTTHATVEAEPHPTFLERLLSTQYFTIYRFACYIVQAQLVFMYPSSFLYPLLLEQDVLIHDGVVLHEL